MTDQGWYLYAVSRGLTADDVDGVEGLAGRPVRLVPSDSLCAVVSEVDLDEFGEDGLRRNLEDLEWLERVARTHDTVVARVSDRAATAPLRLGTICLGDEAVRTRLKDRRDQLAAILDAVDGRAEWSVKVYHRAKPTDSVESPTAESGTAYLQRRRAESARRQQEDRTDTALAEQIHQTVSRVAVDSRRLRPQDPRLAGYDGTMTLNGAYLMERDRSAEIEELISGISAEHPDAGVELGGPWPPYSFATLEQS